jgi:hypothetical protein
MELMNYNGMGLSSCVDSILQQMPVWSGQLIGLRTVVLSSHCSKYLTAWPLTSSTQISASRPNSVALVAFLPALIPRVVCKETKLNSMV